MYMCDGVDCDEEYIGESARTLGKRPKEHPRAPSSIYDHTNITDPQTSVDNFTIVGRDLHNLARTIKEATYTRVNDTSLYRNLGKYQQLRICDKVLFNTPDLKHK